MKKKVANPEKIYAYMGNTGMKMLKSCNNSGVIQGN